MSSPGASLTLADRGNWATTTAYAVGDVVTQSGNRYICETAHTSGTFATDLAAAKWVLTGVATATTLAEGGTWATSTAYALGAVVTVGSIRYAALAAHTSGTFATDLAGGKWLALDIASSSGIRKRGFAIPKGSLDVWDAARNNSASTHADVLCSGDSTTQGILNTGSNGAGWIPKLRVLSIADGVTDGGRGQILGVFDTATVSGESFAAFVSRTGWAAANTNTPPGDDPFSSNTVGDVLTLQYKAPSNAIRVRASSNNSTGRLTVAVNGSTVGTIDPWTNVNQAQTLGTYGEKVFTITGLTAGGTGQTVTITNTGGAPMPDPIQFRTAGTATTGGSVPGGASYTYAATFVDSTGKETALSPKANQTVPAGTSTNTVTCALDNTVGSASAGNVPAGITKARLYRANGANQTNASSFLLVQEITSSGNAQIVFTDTAAAGTTTAPSASQSPYLDGTGAPKSASITVDFYDSTKGITYHRAGYSGQKYGVLYASSGSTTATCNYDMQTHLGLVPGLGSAAVGMDWSSPADSSAAARKVALAICVFGINDLNTTTSGTLTADLQSVVEGVSTFVHAARSAGADPLVVIPHLDYAADTTHMPYLGLFKQAILNTADAHGVAWCDFNEALGPPTTARVTSYGTVHLTQSGYDGEGAFLWNNVAGPNAPR